jgi:hypothetical protein
MGAGAITRNYLRPWFLAPKRPPPEFSFQEREQVGAQNAKAVGTTPWRPDWFDFVRIDWPRDEAQNRKREFGQQRLRELWPSPGRR